MNVLKRPLHRLFLRGTARAVLTREGSYKVPKGDDVAETLASLTGHLDKYDIRYGLDRHCSGLARALEAQREEYESACQRGRSAKAAVAVSEIAPLRTSLDKVFVRPLTELQLRAVNHLQKVGNGANFSVPGSGKTSIALAYYYLLRQDRIVDSLLVIGPVSSFRPWEAEYEKCFGESPECVRIAGKPKEERKEIYQFRGRSDLLLVSYHTAARDVDLLLRLLRRRKFLLVLDESHYVKKPQGGVIAEAAIRVAHGAARRVILTGTPMPNGLSDLWSQITFLWPRVRPLGDSAVFLRRLNKAEGKVALHNVRRQIDPLFFRITKSQLRLPRATFKRVKCSLSPLQHRIYRGVVARFLSQVDEAPRDKEALREWRRARAVRLLQVASNPSLLVKRHSVFQLPPLDFKDIDLRTLIEHYSKHEIPGKLSASVELTRRLVRRGRKVVIWSTFVHNLAMLKNHLQETNPVVIHGGVPYDATDDEELNREGLIARFKGDPECMVLIANPAACAESISLHTVCHDAVYVDRSFNCAHYLQSLDRIHRLGLPQETKTTYYLLIAPGTIDEVVDDRLKGKMRAMRSVVEGDLPDLVPGYWGIDLGAQEDVDLEHVEVHLKDAATQ